MLSDWMFCFRPFDCAHEAVKCGRAVRQRFVHVVSVQRCTGTARAHTFITNNKLVIRLHCRDRMNENNE